MMFRKGAERSTGLMIMRLHFLKNIDMVSVKHYINYTDMKSE